MRAFVQGIRTVAEDTIELDLRLDGATPLTFRAGQYGKFSVPEPEYADRKSTRKFSLVHAPTTVTGW